MASLEEIRKKLQAMEDARSGNSSKPKFTNADTAVFPFWNMGDGDSSTLRFLPDKDSNNTFFWVERQLINIPFRGIIGGEENKEVTVSVPCVEMWGEECPVTQELRPWYKTNDEELKKLAGVYWKKRTYLFQGFVRSTKLAENNKPENPIRRFWVKPQVFNLIKAVLLDTDVKHLPTHYEQGFDFILTKGKKGQWADYSTSRWSRGTSSLTQEERDAIDQHGLFNLNDFLPKKPSSEEFAAIYEMFKASLEGELYDSDRWSQFYKPKGVEFSKKQDNETQDAVVEKTVDVKEEPKQTETVSSEAPASKAGKSTQEILDMLKNRNK